MDYKKKYEKLVDAVKVLRDNNPSDEGIQNWVNDNVTELKESEDERIRKEIIEMLRSWALEHYITKKQFSERMTWLEKQGKETSWKPSKEEMDVLYGLAYITNKYDEHKEEVITRLYQDLKREFFNGSSYENMFPNTEDGVRRRSTIQVLEYARSLDNYNQYGKADIDKNIAWLEKQGKYALEARIDNELVEEVYSHLDSIKETADRMTSGNFMHNKAAIKFSANTITKVLELIGIKNTKG